MKTFKDANEISKIVDLIHDLWFDKDSIRFDSAGASLVINFRRPSPKRKQVLQNIWFLRKVAIPIVECVLKINYSTGFSIEDEANIGTYDFNELFYSPEMGRLTITTGFPMKVQVDVKTFEIVVEETDNVLENKVRWTLC